MCGCDRRRRPAAGLHVGNVVCGQGRLLFLHREGESDVSAATANHKVELRFYAPPGRPPGEGGTMDIGKVMRASGVVAFLEDPKLKERLLEERPFLRPTAENIAIFRVEKGDAWFWTFSDSGRESAIERISF
jgi:hypothetical protein